MFSSFLKRSSLFRRLDFSKVLFLLLVIFLLPNGVKAQQCSGNVTLTSFSGTITDGPGNYNNSQSCSWLIQISDADSVRFAFSSFVTESGYDYVVIYRGTSGSGTPLASYSGSLIPNTISYLGNTFFVRFYTDGSEVRSGFSLNYEGRISCIRPTTPVINYSGPTTIRQGEAVTLRTVPVSGQTYLWSNGSTADTLRVTTQGLYTVRTIANNCTSLSSNPVFINVLTGCNGLTTYTSPSGSFTDGPSNYENNANCKYLIQVPGATYINLNFSQFNTVISSDSLNVYRGTDSLGVLIGTYSGSSLPTDLTVEGNSVFVQFISDGSGSSAGYIINYSSGVCVLPTTPIIIPSGPTTFLLGGSVTLTASSASSYIWSTGATTQSIVARNEGIYTVRTIQNGCTSATSARIIVSNTVNYILSTLAGSGAPGLINGTGSGATFTNPNGVATDNIGNVFVADFNNNCIRKITQAGVVTTFAGSEVSGNIDNLGTQARFTTPLGLCIDKNNNVYVADYGNSTIRKITPAGLVTTIAGSGTTGYLDGLGTGTRFNQPSAIAVDTSGNLYVADYGNRRIRKISTTGQVTTIAGSGNFGYTNGNALQAAFSGLFGIALDASGNIYVADESNHAIRKITPTGTVSTFAGGNGSGFTNGTGTSVRFSTPTGVAVDNLGNVFVADINNNSIRKITPAGVVTTLIGLASPGFVNGNNTVARFNRPFGLCLANNTTLYVADQANNSIRKATPDCIAPNVPAISGNNSFCFGGSSVLTSSALNGNLWSTGDTTRSITVTTAGAYSVRNVQNSCTSAFSAPVNVVVNGITPTVTANGNTTFCTGNSVVLTSSIPTGNFWNNGATTQSITVNSSGTYTVVNIRSNCTSVASAPVVVQVLPLPATPNITVSGPTTFCTGGSVTFSAPLGFRYIWSNGDTSQSITTSIAGTYRVRVIQNGCTSAFSASQSVIVTGTTPTITAVGPTTFTLGGSVTLVASPGSAYLWSNGATTQSIVVTTDGSYTVRTIENGCTSAVSAPIVVSTVINYIVSTLAGSGNAGSTNGIGDAASFSNPNGVAADNLGNIYVADYNNNCIRKITSNGVVTTLAGSTSAGYVNNIGVNARFRLPIALCSDNNSNIYVADVNNHSIRKITPDGTVTTFAGNGTSGYVDGIGTSARFNQPAGIAIDATGNLYVTDFSNTRIRKISPIGEVTTLAGSGISGFRNGIGTEATFNGIRGIATDAAGNVYVADGGNNAIRKITPDGTVSTFAGGNGGGFTNGLGSVVRFNLPTGVAVDNQGYVFVADNSNNCIRKITPQGAVTTVAGLGSSGFVNGNSTVARFSSPFGLCIENNNAIYVADQSNNSIRKIVPDCIAPSVPTITGNISFCSGGSSVLTSSALFGNLWSTGDTTRSITVTTAGSYSVRNIQNNCTSASTTPVNVVVNGETPRVISSGSTSICVGGSVILTSSVPTGNFWNNGATTQSITVNAAGSYTVVNIQGNCTSTASAPVVVQVTPIPTTPVITANGPTTFCTGGSVTLVASPSASYLWSTGATTQSIVVRTDGSYTVRSIGNGCTSAASAPIVVTTINNFEVSTFAGSGNAAFANGIGIGASFSSPIGAAIDANGNIYVADYVNQRIRKITPSGIVSTFAGTGAVGSQNGLGTEATFNNPSKIAIDAAGNLYVSEYRGNLIRKITPQGLVTTLAGSGSSGLVNGTGANASFNQPAGIAVDLSGNVYVAEFANHTIRKITPAGVVTTFAGSGIAGATNAVGTSAQFNQPYDLAIDNSGFLYVADVNNNQIRKVSPTGTVTTLAGSGASGFLNGTGTAAMFNRPFGVAVNSAGEVYVSDRGNNVIRKISPAGAVTTYAGSISGYLDGPSSNARFSIPRGICIDNNGNLYVADQGNNRIRKISPPCLAPSIPTIATNGPTTFCSGGSVVLTSSVAPSYIWNNGDTSRTLLAINPGSYSVSTILNGCTSVNSSPVTVNVNPTPPTPVVTASLTNLVGTDSSVISVNNTFGNAIYVWSNGQIGSRIVTRTSDTLRVRAVLNDCISEFSAPLVITSLKKGIQKAQFHIYPNPALDKVYVNTSIEGTVSVLDLFGKPVLQQFITGNAELSIGKLPVGVYFVHFNGSVIKLIKK